MKEVVLIPYERKGVVTEKVRKRIKAELDIGVTVIDNSVELEGEGLTLLTAKNIIKAIARGFSPDRSWRLLLEDSDLDVMDISKLSDRRQATIRARIIGTNGLMRERIEEASQAYVSVYGKTISIIGNWNQIRVAHTAIEKLIGGAMHRTVLKYLEKARV
jgi:ribosomal RNA assembly protein